jgi:hypothetical protein
MDYFNFRQGSKQRGIFDPIEAKEMISQTGGSINREERKEP